VAGVLTGPHSAARLARSGATHVIDSVAGLPQVLAEVRGGSPVPAAR
jgi:phosphoglycolate phosphatase